METVDEDIKSEPEDEDVQSEPEDEDVKSEPEDEDVMSEPEDEEEVEVETAVPKRNRKARLIVRNLSFKVCITIVFNHLHITNFFPHSWFSKNVYLIFQASAKKLRKFFSPYGELTDVQILRQPNGRLVGCGFVEFASKTSAAKAIAHISGKPFLGAFFPYTSLEIILKLKNL